MAGGAGDQKLRFSAAKGGFTAGRGNRMGGIHAFIDTHLVQTPAQAKLTEKEFLSAVYMTDKELKDFRGGDVKVAKDRFVQKVPRDDCIALEEDKEASGLRKGKWETPYAYGISVHKAFQHVVNRHMKNEDKMTGKARIIVRALKQFGHKAIVSELLVGWVEVKLVTPIDGCGRTADGKAVIIEVKTTKNPLYTSPTLLLHPNIVGRYRRVLISELQRDMIHAMCECILYNKHTRGKVRVGDVLLIHTPDDSVAMVYRIDWVANLRDQIERIMFATKESRGKQ